MSSRWDGYSTCAFSWNTSDYVSCLTYGRFQVVNQVEAHPGLPQDNLVTYCKQKNICITAYSPLGNNSWFWQLALYYLFWLEVPSPAIGRPKFTEHPIVTKLAKQLGVTPAQVLIAWGVRRGYAVIPKSVHYGSYELEAIETRKWPCDVL
jgi:diketogulonate reductase-like aldo/keto reductase